ncbi:MAG: hypothetical protein Q8P41_19310 [Pseudomonadota bacterium]|nr:hypothetical protein [Pseudomonadota bacterium]
MLLATLLALSHAVPTARAEAYALNDAGITLDTPAGWEMTRWSDWDWKGKSGDGAVAVEVWYTPFQVAITKDAAERWAGIYGEKLDEMRALGVLRDTVAIEEIAGRPTARTTMRFSFDRGGPKGVMVVAAFPVEGKVMHVATLAAAPNAGKAAAALDTLLTRLTVQKPAAEILALGGTATTPLGFTATLPDGWRRPLPIEEAEADKAVAAIVIGPKDPSACLRAIRPSPGGEVDVLLFCGETWKMGILDEDSFAFEEARLKQRFFGKAADKVPAAQPLPHKDRLGMLLTPEINGKDLRIGALPYDRGTVVVWGVSEPGGAEVLASAIRATSASLAFEGPDGGASVHEIGEWIVHTLTYRPWHPAVIGAGAMFLAVLGGFGWLVFRKPKVADPLG